MVNQPQGRPPHYFRTNAPGELPAGRVHLGDRSQMLAAADAVRFAPEPRPVALDQIGGRGLAAAGRRCASAPETPIACSPPTVLLRPESSVTERSRHQANGRKPWAVLRPHEPIATPGRVSLERNDASCTVRGIGLASRRKPIQRDQPNWMARPLERW